MDRSWIDFGEPAPSETGKTSVWTVRSVDGIAKLGVVSWFGRWRRYAFFPEPATVFEQDCLRGIATFCESKTSEHRRR